MIRFSQPFPKLWHSARTLYNFPSQKNFEAFVLELVRCAHSSDTLAFGVPNKEKKEIDVFTPLSFFQAVRGNQKICLRPLGDYYPPFECSAVSTVYLTVPPGENLVTDVPIIGLLQISNELVDVQKNKQSIQMFFSNLNL